jgi:two-component system phosphate regulon sensor histidine kinase PhoR
MSRRVVACYLLFSAAAAVCLAAPGPLWPLARWPAAVLLFTSGAWLLQRMLRVASAVETQLARLARRPLRETPLELVVGSSAAAVGWNRLVAEVARAADDDGLHNRLGTALQAYRNHSNGLILDSFPEGVAVTDPHGQITYANPTLSALLFDEGEDSSPEGDVMYDHLSREAAHNEIAALLEPDSLQRSVVVELTRFDLDSESVLRVARYPLRGRGDNAESHVWSVRDVTQQKLAEKMHTEFVNSATHELRTPMANIKAYAETLAQADELAIEEQKEFCNTINAEVSRLSRMIDDLLSIESMEVGSLALVRLETDVERLLREKVEMARPLMDKKSLSFQVRLPEKLPKMLLDKDKIALAIDNLLGNAAKYTPPGGEVALRVDIDEEALQIHVQDSGVGIAEGELAKVFDKFFRSADVRVREETGTGLGLAMVREIVTLHGGEITVKSKLDEGSTFSITLPMG